MFARLSRIRIVCGCSGPSAFSIDRQRPLEERPRAGEIALVPKQEGEVVEARGGQGVLGAERLLVDCHRSFEERPRGGEVALGLK